MFRRLSPSCAITMVASPAMLFLVLVQFSLAPALSAQTTSGLQVDYTGRLFGYYRIEPNETRHDGPPSQN
jgi:hypothetical protein